MGDFNFNAPQYVDFTSPNALELKEYGDEYFDMDHEIEVDYHEEYYNHEEVVETTEIQDELIIEKVDATIEKPKLRRSVSAGEILVNIVKIQDEACDLGPAMEALQLCENQENKSNNGYEVHKSNLARSRSKSASTHSLNKPLYQRSRAVSRDAINKIGQPKGDHLKRKMSVENLQPNKYISLAEAVIKFQCGTPKRFHSKATNTQFNNHKNPTLACTIPQSPMLSTKSRSRAPNCVSRQEQEQMEADEMKKNQIKANAVNYKILRAPVLNAKVGKKPNTVPQPFKFAEVQFHKPTLPPKTEVYEFHARPAPKTTLASMKPITRRSCMPTVAITPTFIRKPKETYPKLEESSVTKTETFKEVVIHHDGLHKQLPKNSQKSGKTSVKTKIEPFSFEQRDKMMQKRKEEKIKKFLDEEKKAREFHARPIPTKIACGSGQVESKIAKMLHGVSTSNTSLNSVKNDENAEPNQILFKAKPATVIHKKPFIPKKEDRPLLEISEFQLNTDKRAKEREEFEKKMKEKEEEYEIMKHELVEKQKQLEIEEYNKLRKETVHKANPIKHYKPVEILPSSKKITSPISPMITKKRMSRMDH